MMTLMLIKQSRQTTKSHDQREMLLPWATDEGKRHRGPKKHLLSPLCVLPGVSFPFKCLQVVEEIQEDIKAFNTGRDGIRRIRLHRLRSRLRQCLSSPPSVHASLSHPPPLPPSLLKLTLSVSLSVSDFHYVVKKEQKKRVNRVGEGGGRVLARRDKNMFSNGIKAQNHAESRNPLTLSTTPMPFPLAPYPLAPSPLALSPLTPYPLPPHLLPVPPTPLPLTPLPLLPYPTAPYPLDPPLTPSPSLHRRHSSKGPSVPLPPGVPSDEKQEYNSSGRSNASLLSPQLVCVALLLSADGTRSRVASVVRVGGGQEEGIGG